MRESGVARRPLLDDEDEEHSVGGGAVTGTGRLAPDGLPLHLTPRSSMSFNPYPLAMKSVVDNPARSSFSKAVARESFSRTSMSELMRQWSTGFKGEEAEQWDEESVQLMRQHFYFTVPWSPQVYFTVRGSENLHIYLWIAKDLSWTQGWYFPALVFGIAALSWCSVLCYHAYQSRCKHEMYLIVALTLWLAGNFVWMGGEIIEPEMGSRLQASHIMEVAIGWMLIYHLCIKPCGLIPRDKLLDLKYEAAGLKPRFQYFANWRQYEHVHTLCWLGKDLSWILLDKYTWVIFLVPTCFIALDFIYTTARNKNMFIDCVHYVSQFMWVMANAVWALSELFDVPGFGDDDVAHSPREFSREATERCRWWSSWLLIAALLPIIALYAVWLPLTCMGKIKTSPTDDWDI